MASSADVTAGNFAHFEFGKVVITGEFGERLIIIIAFIKEIGGNAIGFTVFKAFGINGKLVSVFALDFGFNKMAVRGVEGNFITFADKIPFAVIAEDVELEGIVEIDFTVGFVVPDAEDIAFVIKVIFILGSEAYFIEGIGIIRLCFLQFSAAGKKKRKAKKNQNNFFQKKQRPFVCNK